MLTASASFLLCSVERGSVADTCGLKVGDQILEVNGHDFHSILHAEAASILKAYPTLMITVKVCDVTMVTTLTMYLHCTFAVFIYTHCGLGPELPCWSVSTMPCFGLGVWSTEKFGIQQLQGAPHI